jgi:hypothetical protein
METELDGDNEARSGKQGGGSRKALIGAVFDRLRFQNLHDGHLLEAQVEKDNFHQFNSDFHKEKEMVDFRKWLFALAAAGLLLGIGSSAANAQGTMQCTTTAGGGVNNIIRSEGITELLGDLIINCTNGTPTAPTVAIPLENIQISINAYITSRIEDPATSASEALLLVDSPYPATGIFPVPPNGGAQAPNANNAHTQLACQALNSVNCAIISKGEGVGTPGNYDGTPGHYNVFQGYQSGLNSIAWNGVPIDAPGTAGTRVIRITNVRANAFQLGVSSTLIPTQISMIVSVNGSAVLNLNQPANGSVVATIVPGLIGASATGAYQQCNNLNGTLLQPTALPGQSGSIIVSAKEGFAAAFKTQNYTQLYDVSTSISGGLLDTTYLPPGQSPMLQNIPGFNYNSESGFYPGGGIGLDQSATEPAGLADHGTQIQFTIVGVGAGVSLFAPSYVYMSGSYGTGQTVGVGVLVSQTASGTGAITNTSGVPVAYWPATGITPAPGPNVSVGISGTTATLTYEIYYADPSVQETMALPVTAAFVTTGPTNPAPTTAPSTVAINFAPLNPAGTTATASSSEPIPNFGQPHAAANLYTISPCSCNLLFPFVTNIAGFDTGIAIANTTADPYGTPAQAGTVTLNYYGTTSGGGAAPPAATTTSTITGGQEVIFTLSTGGNFGVPATPGFEGYIIAEAQFQYCHGFAFISDVGAQKLAEGYLAIQLDVPGLNRTLNTGENEGH